MLEGIHRAIAPRLCFASTSLLVLALSAAPAYAEAKEDYSKVTIANRYLFAQPNASAPAPVLLTGLDADILEEYDDWTLARVRRSSLEDLRSRALTPAVEVRLHDEYDTLYAGGSLIDTRLGLTRSVPGREIDPSYAGDETGAWIVQFIGPTKPQWVEALGAEKVTSVQYLPYNAFVVGARASAIDRVSRLPFVQFVTQLHTFLKPAFRSAPATRRELWIQLVTSDDTPLAIALLEKLSVAGVRAAPWSAVETRVEGTFHAEDLDTILREPLVIAVSERPTIAMSDERVGISLTGLAPPGSGGRYKKWLADVCEACGNRRPMATTSGSPTSGWTEGLTPPRHRFRGSPPRAGYTVPISPPEGSSTGAVSRMPAVNGVHPPSRPTRRSPFTMCTVTAAWWLGLQPAIPAPLVRSTREGSTGGWAWPRAPACS